MRNITAIIGTVCSGKDTTAKTKFSDCKHIDIANIVRSITRTQRRVHNKNLDADIIQELYIQMSATGPTDLVITGIRQLTIYQWLEEFCEKHYNFKTVVLSCPPSICKERYKDRNSEKDLGIEFEEVVARDNELGLKDLLETLKCSTNPRVTYLKSY